MELALAKFPVEEIAHWHSLLPGDHSFRSQGHGNELVRILFNTKAQGSFQRKCGLPFPPGSMIAKAFLTNSDTPTLQARRIFFMKKHPPGYDPSHGDWEYGAAHIRSGRWIMTNYGTIPSCIPCHEAYSRYDYVFSVERFREYNTWLGPVKLWLGL
jgi:hypothetical protein